MVDIHYNSGGITDEKWPNMLDALRINNFDWAAKESRRGDVQALRNAEAARLILQGKKELKHKREKGTWR